ncbi:MAG: methyltransferase domain-containing protein [Proteobacteria bacterium]|nr:methyltransferase domain-containing protein [Pseudomonadota bacterium]
MRIDRGHHTDLDYHRRMLDDIWRVEAFDRALRRRIRPGDVVLDLGAGTGLLSMLAARLGARVHAVESASVGAVAERLIQANGLSDRIVLHRADAVELEPVEEVDLVVGEFLGRFVIDDEMLDAVTAAGRWLRPGGGFCPSEIRMQLAPAGDFSVPMVDRWRTPLLGLDLDAALPIALNSCYATKLGESALLAGPQTYAVLKPPSRPEFFDTTVDFEIQRDGVLRGVLGFWSADLAEGVVLSTAPGIDTHWGQYLFPCTPMAVQAGDRLQFRLRLDESGVPVWIWSGSVEGSRTEVWSGQSIFDAEALPRPDATAWSPDRDRVISNSNLATAAFGAGDIDQALRYWQKSVSHLGPDSEDLAGIAYENLGIGLLNAGLPLAAAENFARALDGGLERDQSLRLMVTALEHCGRPLDLHRWSAILAARE